MRDILDKFKKDIGVWLFLIVIFGYFVYASLSICWGDIFS